MAIEAPFDLVTRELIASGDWIATEDSLEPELIVWGNNEPPRASDSRNLTCSIRPDRRSVVVAKGAHSSWTVVLRSIDFVQSSDIDWSYETAKQLSGQLATRAIACSGEEVCDCFVFSKSRVAKKLSGVETAKADSVFQDDSVYIPLALVTDDPPRIWITDATRRSLESICLMVFSIPTASKSPPTQSPTRTRFAAHRGNAVTCVEIVKLKALTPCKVSNRFNSYHTTVREVVFDPLHIDEVNSRFLGAGYAFDDEVMKVVAVNDDDSILLWGGTSVYAMRKGDVVENSSDFMVMNDVLELTFPFKIKNKKVDIDAMLVDLQKRYDEPLT